MIPWDLLSECNNEYFISLLPATKHEDTQADYTFSIFFFLSFTPKEPFRALIFIATWVIEATYFIFEVISDLSGCFEATMA